MKVLTDEEIEREATEIMTKIKTYEKAYDTRYGIVLGMKLCQRIIVQMNLTKTKKIRVKRRSE